MFIGFEGPRWVRWWPSKRSVIKLEESALRECLPKSAALGVGWQEEKGKDKDKDKDHKDKDHKDKEKDKEKEDEGKGDRADEAAKAKAKTPEKAAAAVKTEAPAASLSPDEIEDGRRWSAKVVLFAGMHPRRAPCLLCA